MRLTFIGKETQGGGSPTLFATDRGTYVVQGWKVADDALSVEIPKALLDHLADRPPLASPLHDTGHGTYVLSGAAMNDPEALAHMDIPAHETCVEVGRLIEDDAHEAVSR